MNFVQEAGSLLCQGGDSFTAWWQNKRLVKSSGTAGLALPTESKGTQSGAFRFT